MAALAAKDKRIRAERQALAAERAERDAFRAQEKMLQEDPVGYFTKIGISPERLGELLLKQQGLISADAKKTDPNSAKDDNIVNELRTKLERLEAERQKEREDAKVAEHHAERNKIVNQLHQRIVADDRFEAAKTYADYVVPIDGVAARPAEHVLNILQRIYREGVTLRESGGVPQYYPPGTDLRNHTSGLDSVVMMVNNAIVDFAKPALSIRALQPKAAAPARGNTVGIQAQGREGDTPATKPRPPITNSRASTTTISSSRQASDADRIAAALAAMSAARKR